MQQEARNTMHFQKLVSNRVFMNEMPIGFQKKFQCSIAPGFRLL